MSKKKNKAALNLAARKSTASTEKAKEVEKILKEAEAEVQAQEQTTAKPEKPAPKPEPKPEPQKQDPPKQENTENPKQDPPTIQQAKLEGEFPPQSKLRKKSTVQTITPEVVPETSGLQTDVNSKSFKVNAMKNLANGDRISANSGITLMNLIHQRYLQNPDTPENLKQAFTQQFDAMALYHMIHWNTQVTTELGETGIKVNTKMFDAISEGLATYFGITAKGLPTPDGQLQLQFEVPEEVKNEVQNVPKPKPQKNTELPVYAEGKTEEQIQSDLETIMGAQNGMGGNLLNAIQYARNAYKMKNDTPAKVVCKIMDSLPRTNLLLNAYGRSVYGSMSTNAVPFTGIALLRKHLPNMSLDNLVELSRVFFSLGAQLNIDKINRNKTPKLLAESYLKPWNSLFAALNDQIILDIANTADGKDELRTVAQPKIKGLLQEANFDTEKIITQVRASFGASLNAKQLKTQMSSMLAKFTKESINPLEKYVEHGYNTGVE